MIAKSKGEIDLMVTESACRRRHGILQGLFGLLISVLVAAFAVPWWIAQGAQSDVRNVKERTSIVESRAEDMRINQAASEVRILLLLAEIKAALKELAQKVDRQQSRPSKP
jgi:hypothetical protein